MATIEEERRKAMAQPPSGPIAGMNQREMLNKAGIEMYSNGPLTSPAPPFKGAQPSRPAAAQAVAQPSQASGGGLIGMVRKAMPGTSAVFSESGKTISDLASQGRYGAAAGEAGRAALAYIPAVADDVIGAPLRAAGPGILDAGKQLLGMNDPAAPSARPTVSATQPTATQPTATQPTATQPTATQPTATTTDVRRIDNAIDARTPGNRNAGGQPGRTAQPSQATEVRPGIFRQGNSFGDSPEAAAEFAGPNRISAQNMQAADALAAKYRTPIAQLAAGSGGGYSMRDDSGQAGQAAPGAGMYVAPDSGGYGLMDKNRLRERELRMATTSTKSNLESSAGYKARMAGAANALANFQDEQTNAPRNAAERDLKSQELALRGQEMQANQGFRIGQLANDSARTGLEGQRVRSELEARGMEVGQAKQMQDLRSEYLNAKTDAERNTAAQKLQAMAGKPQDQQNRYTVVPGGQEWDTNASAMRNVPGRVLNNQTGQFVDGQQSQQGPKAITADAAGKAAFAALPKGAAYVGPDGKQYVKN